MTTTTTNPRLGRLSSDTPEGPAQAGTHAPQAVEGTAPNAGAPAGADHLADQGCPDTPRRCVGQVQTPPPAAGSAPSPEDHALPVVDPLLFVHATAHGDLEQQRIASEHRLRILTTTEADDDGVMRGFGLDESHPDVARLVGITEALRKLEHDAMLGMNRSLRRSAIYPWVKAQVGLGDKQVARLLAVIGDPYWNLTADRPRTVSQLWAYCGLHVLPASQTSSDAHTASAGGAQASDLDQSRFDSRDQIAIVGVAARRRKGQQANWSTEAKTRAYLIAVSCIKCAASPYRSTYVGRRAHTAGTHPEWTPGHSHNDALRVASKAILRDLWREARHLHQGGVA